MDEERFNTQAQALANQITTSAVVNGMTAGNDKKARAWQEKMYAKQLEDNYAMLANTRAYYEKMLANERDYNSSKSQVERLKEAGLNPALAYGGDLVTPGSSMSPAMQSPSISGAPSTVSHAALGFDPSTTVASAAAMKQAKTSSFLSRSEDFLNLVKAGLLDSQTAGQELANLYNESTLSDRIGLVTADLQSAHAKVSNIRLQNVNLSNEISLFEQRSRKLASEIDNIQAQTGLTHAQRSQAIANTARNWAESELARQESLYTKVQRELAGQHLSQEEYRTKMQEVTYWNDLVTGDIEILANSVSSVFGGVGKGIMSGIFGSKRMPRQVVNTNEHSIDKNGKQGRTIRSVETSYDIPAEHQPRARGRNKRRR